MPRLSQPRQVAEAKGATRKHPERYRNDPPESIYPLGDAPDDLDDLAKKCWFEMSTYAPRGALNGADRFMLEMAAVLLAEFRRDRDAFAVGKYTRLQSCYAHLGLSLASRQKLGTEKPQDENPFNTF